jgi:hypothetical protein
MLSELSDSLRVRAPLLLKSPGVGSPLLTGLQHSAILLPPDCERQFDGRTLRLILAHELIHLARRDCAWNLLARLACAMGWVQPLLWVLGRRLEQAGEEVCDQEVIRLEGDARAYARCLLVLSEQLMPSPSARALGVGVGTIRSSLGKRIQRILERARQHPLPPSNRLRAVVALAASVAVVLGLVLASAIAAPSAERDGTSKHVLRDVPELDKRVTYTETKIPLEELIQKVSADTGAPLAAAPEVADEPVAVVVKEIPARELLEQVADLLDYSWRVRRSGVQALRRSGPATAKSDPFLSTLNARTPERPNAVYEIWQDLASKQREEALRNALRADVIRRFQAELNRYVEMASWTPERLRKFRDDARRPTRAGDPDAGERARRFHIAWTMMSPISRSVGQFLGRLLAEQWATVREGKMLTFSTDPQPGELAMPAETASVLRAVRPTLYPPGEQVGYDDPNGPEQARHVEQGIQAQWAAATGYRVTVQIDANGWRSLNMLRLTAAARPFRSGATPQANFFDAYPGTSVQIQTEPSEPMAWEQDAAMPPESELANDPIFGSRQLFKPGVKPRKEMFADPFTPAMFRMRDLLPDLARTYKVQFIADAYTPVNGRMGAQAFTGLEPLYRILSAATPTHRWDRRGNLIRLRSRTWFLDRPKEIPLRLVRHWKELTDQHGTLPLETYLEMARTLTDLQMENVGNVVEDVELPPTIRWFELGRDRYALRLYAALSPDQQQALWGGKVLQATQMTPAQRELFLASLAERALHNPLPPKLERWSDARLSLEAEPQTVTVERSAGPAVTQPVPASPASPSGQPPSRVGANSTPAAGPLGSRPAAATTFPVTRLNLQLGYAPDQQDEVTLTVAAPSPKTAGAQASRG